jgi:hypothetical protein
VVIADAGYGSEEHYHYLENQGIRAVVKYGRYRKEGRLKWGEDPWNTEGWEYHRKERYSVCPAGRRLTFRERKKEKNHRGYRVTIDRYEGESCKYCRLKKQCTKAKGNRVIDRNERWLRLKWKARRALEHHEELRKQRSVAVETVFGQLKGNQGYRRFLLRGTAKVSTEWGLLGLGYNLKQIHRINNQKPA